MESCSQGDTYQSCADGHQSDTSNKREFTGSQRKIRFVDLVNFNIINLVQSHDVNIHQKRRDQSLDPHTTSKMLIRGTPYGVQIVANRAHTDCRSCWSWHRRMNLQKPYEKSAGKISGTLNCEQRHGYHAQGRAVNGVGTREAVESVEPASASVHQILGVACDRAVVDIHGPGRC